MNFFKIYIGSGNLSLNLHLILRLYRNHAIANLPSLFPSHLSVNAFRMLLNVTNSRT